MIRFCPLLHVVPQGVSPLGISTGDMMVVARSFPSLRTLALSDIDQAALGWEQECQLKPLSQLTGLTDLSIAARRVFPDSTLASLSSLKRLASLKLQLIRVHDGFDGFCQQVFPHLRSLWGLRHLAHLSCTYIDSKPPPCIGRVPNNPDNVLQPHRVAAPPLDLFSTGRMITTLSGCKKLSSLQLPWAILAEGAAERLAKELPQLTRLSVNCLWPGSQMPACSWRERGHAVRRLSDALYCLSVPTALGRTGAPARRPPGPPPFHQLGPRGQFCRHDGTAWPPFGNQAAGC